VSRVNLLPPELRQREVARRNTRLVILVGVGLLVLIGAFYFVQVMNLSEAKDDLAAQQQVNAGLEAQIAELQQYATLEQQLAAEQELVSAVYTNEVSWSNILLDVSRAVPSQAYLTNFTGQISMPSAEGTTVTTAPSNLVGSISFAGEAKEMSTLAAWLARLEDVEGWVNAWVSSANETGPYTKVYTFSSGVDLTSDVVTERGKGGAP
jgi:Tfp pilus assembly protein PilN